MSTHHALWLRMLSALLLLSLVINTVPPPVAQSTVAEVVTTPATVVAAQPTTPMIPRPPEARLSGVSIEDVEEFEQAYGARHTLQQGESTFDGTFSTPRILIHTEAAPPNPPVGVTGATSSTFTIPLGMYDSAKLDITFVGGTKYRANAAFALLPEGSNKDEWPETGAIVHSSSIGVAATETDYRLMLGSIAQPDTPTEIKLQCNGGRDREITQCDWSNLRFYTDAAGWRLNQRPYSFKSPPFNDVQGEITEEPYTGSQPQDGPFFVVQTFHENGGVGANTKFMFHSPLLQFPAFTETDVLSMSVQWALQPNEDTPWLENPGAYDIPNSIDQAMTNAPRGARFVWSQVEGLFAPHTGHNLSAEPLDTSPPPTSWDTIGVCEIPGGTTLLPPENGLWPGPSFVYQPWPLTTGGPLDQIEGMQVLTAQADDNTLRGIEPFNLEKDADAFRHFIANTDGELAFALDCAYRTSPENMYVYWSEGRIVGAIHTSVEGNTLHVDFLEVTEKRQGFGRPLLQLAAQQSIGKGLSGGMELLSLEDPDTIAFCKAMGGTFDPKLHTFTWSPDDLQALLVKPSRR